MINDYVDHYFLTAIDEGLQVNWEKSGLPIDSEIKINNQPVKPYGISLNVVDTWLENIKEVSKGNIEKPAHQKIFEVAFNRMAKKIFPALVPYILPGIKYEGKDVIKEKDITPQQFWKEAWPKVWSEFSSPERLLLQKYTTLNPKTTYDEVMDGLADALDSYSSYKPVIGEQANLLIELMGNSFSGLFGGKKVELSNKMLSDLFTDLNSRLGGGKIDFQLLKKPEVEDGNIKDMKSDIKSAEAKKSFAEIEKQLASFSSDLAKSKSTGGSKNDNQAPIPTDVPSVRNWAKTLDPATKQVIIDTIRSTGMR
jgi:hypothetical protein